MTWFHVVVAWCAASIPVSLIVGRVIRTRGHDQAHCQWCRPDLEHDE